MPEKRSRRWLVTAGATRLAAEVRHGADDAALEVGIGSGDTARTIAARIVSCSADTCVVSVDGRSTVVRLAPHDGGFHAMTGGESFTVTSAAETPAASRHGDGSAAGQAGEPRVGEPASAMDLDALCAPMPATVSAILVEPGTTVDAGEALVRLEAMKMELAIRAPAAGRVAAVDCRVGDLVQPGRPLVTLQASPSTAGKAHG